MSQLRQIISAIEELGRRVGLLESQGPWMPLAVRARKTSAQNVAHATPVSIAWQEVEYDYGGFFDSATPTRLTAPVTGVYHVWSHIEWTSDNSVGFRFVSLRKNGVADEWGSDRRLATAPTEQGTFTTLQLAAGDYIEVRVFHTAGSGVTLRIGTSNDVRFGMERVA